MKAISHLSARYVVHILNSIYVLAPSMVVMIFISSVPSTSMLRLYSMCACYCPLLYSSSAWCAVVQETIKEFEFDNVTCNIFGNKLKYVFQLMESNPLKIP